MKTKITAGNPFSYNRYGFLWEILNSAGPGYHLDYGAYNGHVLARLSETGVIRQGMGLDVNRQTVDEHKAHLPDNVTLRHIQKHEPLPFDNETFDSASMLEVLEHIHDQHFILQELWRVLKTGGPLVITVPRKHVFSVLDASNLKFRFPRLHKMYHTVTKRESETTYHSKYRNVQNGMIGDIESEKKWHQHFSEGDLGEILEECGFSVVRTDGSALFSRPLILLKPILLVGRSLVDRLDRMDARYFGLANLFCIARKSDHLNGTRPKHAKRTHVRR